ncbi:unnamed protein product [Closterium sp. Naga37s-1]|nr:unnamed protein product [Closterium sp. Naga37s-1]
MSLGDVQACELAQRLEQQWGAARQLASDIQTAVAGFLAASVQPPSLVDLGRQSLKAVDRDCDAACNRDEESDERDDRRHDDGARSREAIMARLRGFRWHAQVIRQQSIVLADVTFHLCDVLEASCSLTPEELSRLAGAVPASHPDEASSNLLSELDSPPPLLSSPATDAAAGQASHGGDAGARETASGPEDGGWSRDTREGEWDERDTGVVEQVSAEPHETAQGEDVAEERGELAAWGAKGQRKRRTRRRFYPDERDELRKALLEHLTLLRLEEARAEWAERGESELGDGAWGMEGDRDTDGGQSGGLAHVEESEGEGGWGEEEALMAQARAAAEASRAAARARRGGEGEGGEAEGGMGGVADWVGGVGGPPTLQQGSPRRGLGGREVSDRESMANGGMSAAVSVAEAVADVALMVEQELERERRREQEAVLLGGVTSPPGARPAVPASWQQPWWLSPAAPPAAAVFSASAAGWHASTGMNGVKGDGMPIKGAAGAGGVMERRAGGFAEFSGRSGVGFAAFAGNGAGGEQQGDGKAAGRQQAGAGEEVIVDTKGNAGNARPVPTGAALLAGICTQASSVL